MNENEVKETQKQPIQQPTPEQLIGVIHKAIDQLYTDTGANSYMKGIKDACTSIKDTINELKNEKKTSDEILESIEEMLDTGNN